MQIWKTFGLSHPSRSAEGEEWIQGTEGADAQLALQVLRLVQDQHGAGGLHQVQGKLDAREPIRVLPDDVGRLVEGVDGHHHHLYSIRQSELTELGDVGRVVGVETVRRVAEQFPQVPFGNAQRLQHTLTNSN